METTQSTSCVMCCRPLKNPKSIVIGMGKVCAGKKKAQEGDKQLPLFDFDRDQINQKEVRQ